MPDESLSCPTKFSSCFATLRHAETVVAHRESPSAPASFVAKIFGSVESSDMAFDAVSATPSAKSKILESSELLMIPRQSRMSPWSAESMYSLIVLRSIDVTNRSIADSSTASATSNASLSASTEIVGNSRMPASVAVITTDATPSAASNLSSEIEVIVTSISPSQGCMSVPDPGASSSAIKD